MFYNDFPSLREKTGFSVKETAELFDISERTVYRWDKHEYRPDSRILSKLNTIAEVKNNQYASGKTSFKFIDLFAGIGGLRRAFESVGGKCVFTNEWDKFCRKTYMANFNCDHEITGDIKEVNENSVPEHDVLLAGFPCQPFSIAGVSKKKSLGMQDGFRDETQGTLFFDVARMIEFHRPKAFVLENVKNLLTHDKGKTFSVIMRTLRDELGYQVDYKVINSKGWVPQSRERIFIVGFRDSTNFSLSNLIEKDPMNGPKLNSVLHPEDGTEEPEPPFTDPTGKVNEKYTLSNKLWNYLKEYATKHREKGNGFGFGLNGLDDVARTLSARYYKDGSEILIRQKDKNPRKLTPRECSRLMGFDEHKPFIIPVSDTQAYKQFGNSIVVPVAESIAQHMLPYILDNSKNNRDEQLNLFDMAKGETEPQSV